MHGTIFISYRRAESLVEARALYERVARDFPGRVFIDLEGIDFGDDFVDSLQRQLVDCQVMLVLIGPGWLGQAQAGGHRLIDDDNDFVRIELRIALQRGIRVVPVLLNGAPLPQAVDLPVDLQPLVRRQAMALDFHRFDRDAGALGNMLRRMVKPHAANGEPPDGPRHRLVGWGVAALALAVLLWLVLGRDVLHETPPLPAASAPLAQPKAASAAASAPASVSAPAVGARLRDCAQDVCPWLRVIPTGSFNMGSSATEAGRADNEGPLHAVNVSQRLAVMETEVTRRQFAAFVAATQYESTKGCYYWNGNKDTFDARRDWRHPGFEQTDDHPVVCVSWNDAQAYAKWLSGQTGKRYRLLSEAEWEYAARAGSATRYSFGEREQDLCSFGNVLDLTAKAQYPHIGAKWAHADCTDGAVYTVPVARFKPNAFNLYGMHGNVWEWVQDCWHDDYNGAPAGQAAWEQGCDSEWRVRRGGGWRTVPDVARSAFRARNTPDVRYDMLGFRLARNLGP